MNWKDRKLDIQYLIDSGLLFEINRQLLHPFGIAISLLIDKDKNITVNLKDERGNPGNTIFPTETAKNCKAKYQKFMDDWGYKQLDIRINKMGQSVQHVD